MIIFDILLLVVVAFIIGLVLHSAAKKTNPLACDPCKGELFTKHPKKAFHYKMGDFDLYYNEDFWILDYQLEQVYKTSSPLVEEDLTQIKKAANEHLQSIHIQDK
mgnify:CR=1 FL=1